MATKALPDLSFPASAWRTKWVVYSKPTVQGSEKVVEYLGRYIFRSAITNSRILDFDEKTVTFRYKKSKSKKKERPKTHWRTMKLPVFEFMRRFLQHTLPRGFHKVRYYGLLSPANRPLLHRLQLLLQKPVTDEDLEQFITQPESDEPTTKIRPCPHCAKGFMHRGPDLQRTPSQFLQRAPPVIQ